MFLLKKSKIAFLIPSLEAGGAERVVATLANSLVITYDVTIIVLYKSPIFFKLNPDINIIYCGDEYQAVYSLKHSITSHLKFIRTIIKIIKSNNIRLLIGFMTTPNIYAVIAAKYSGIRSIISERVHPKYTEASKVWFSVRRHLYPFADKLVIQTQDIADYFSRFIKEKNMQIILNPLNPELISKRDITNKENIILNVGRLNYQKNQDMLIRAFSNINPIDWKLIIVGDGKELANYKRLINELETADKVILTGNVEDVSDYYNKSKIFAFTSRYEGFPNALTEAMYFGLASIATDCPSGPSDLITNEENGFLIPSENQKALEDKLRLLMSNSPIREKMGKAAMNDTDKFKIENISLQWEQLINNLLN